MKKHRIVNEIEVHGYLNDGWLVIDRFPRRRTNPKHSGVPHQEEKTFSEYDFLIEKTNQHGVEPKTS